MKKTVSTIAAAALLVATAMPAVAGGHNHGYGYGGGYGGGYHRHFSNWWWGAPLAAAGAAAIVGGALAAPYYYYGGYGAGYYRTQGYGYPYQPAYQPRWCPNPYGGWFVC